MRLGRGLVLACLLALAGLPAKATEIWFGASEPVWRVVRQWPANDWMDLFRPGAPWQDAEADVHVLELTKRAVLETSDADLSAVIAALKQHHIRLAVQATPLLASQVCGLGVEGHGPPDDMLQVATRLKRLGAELDYLTMDEPLFYGHLYEGQGGRRACHSTIAEIAQQTATKMRAVRQIYPAVVIGDDEPVSLPAPYAAEWPTELRDWMDAYHAAMGEKLGFFHADVFWDRPDWRAGLRAAIAVVRQEGVTLGVIYDGTPADQTDAAWVDGAAAHFHAVEGEMHVRPDQAKLQSWMDHPRAMLPEGKPDTMTNLVLRYHTWLQQRH
jgi:hypothetical protein